MLIFGKENESSTLGIYIYENVFIKNHLEQIQLSFDIVKLGINIL